MKRFTIKNVFEACTNTDLDEGRGREVPIAHFIHESDARRAAKGRGVMGTDADVRMVDVDIRVYESFREFELEFERDVRAKALAKLTPEERRALGLV